MAGTPGVGKLVAAHRLTLAMERREGESVEDLHVRLAVLGDEIGRWLDKFEPSGRTAANHEWDLTIEVEDVWPEPKDE